jgi:hypothetical protein
MVIAEARELTVGDTVRFPPDRGQAGGAGVINHLPEGEHKNIHGTQYRWVGLKEGGLWPSNRLT